ncbi:MAG: hypothetical protein II826_06900 [Prevotella sp.]|nr:hypothetical protein [Prevotella sp.]
MNENQYDLLRQQDLNLHEALRQEAAELPPIPDDLNDRVLQRIGSQQKRPAKVHRLWPCVAAACVAAVMVVLMMPPGASPPAPLAKGREVVMPDTQKVEEPVIAKVETTIAQPTAKPAKVKKTRRQTAAAERDTLLIAQEAIALTDAPEAEAPLAAATPTVPDGFPTEEPKPTEPKPVTLTERDIPITRPENYHYTPEELALMRRQANEAYLKWIQLELEIAKYNQEQMAQQ